MINAQIVDRTCGIQTRTGWWKLSSRSSIAHHLASQRCLADEPATPIFHTDERYETAQETSTGMHFILDQ